MKKSKLELKSYYRLWTIMSIAAFSGIGFNYIFSPHPFPRFLLFLSYYISALVGIVLVLLYKSYYEKENKK